MKWMHQGMIIMAMMWVKEKDEVGSGADGKAFKRKTEGKKIMIRFLLFWLGVTDCLSKRIFNDKLFFFFSLKSSFTIIITDNHGLYRKRVKGMPWREEEMEEVEHWVNESCGGFFSVRKVCGNRKNMEMVLHLTSIWSREYFYCAPWAINKRFGWWMVVLCMVANGYPILSLFPVQKMRCCICFQKNNDEGIKKGLPADRLWSTSFFN